MPLQPSPPDHRHIDTTKVGPSLPAPCADGSTADHRVPEQRVVQGPRIHTREAHALRLCLDLQLDTLLLELGLAARVPVRTVHADPDLDPGPSDSLPHRWLEEDLQLTLELARLVMTRNQSLPRNIAVPPVDGEAWSGLRQRYQALREGLHTLAADPDGTLTRSERRTLERAITVTGARSDQIDREAHMPTLPAGQPGSGAPALRPVQSIPGNHWG